MANRAVFNPTFSLNLWIGLAYVLCSGSLVAALFLNDKPSVASSAALFGLISTMLSALVQNWTTYNNKLTAIAVLVSVSIINIVMGLAAVFFWDLCCCLNINLENDSRKMCFL
ncbi:RHOMBOID-like protein 8 isoform X2 [Impatiens glandulifera]|nr:RHOMBOID-like protein 8 isoform X2 [Impatiens glandulifera]